MTSARQPKSEFMRKEGFPLYLETGHRLLDILEQQAPHEIPAQKRTDSPFKQLYHISSQLYETAEGLASSYDGHSRDKFGFTNKDYADLDEVGDKGGYIHWYGTEDLGFPFYFAPALMKDMFEEAKNKLSMPDDAFTDITMRDFANIMRQGWFQDILTATAKTKNGVWRNTGSTSGDYNTFQLLATECGFIEPENGIFSIEIADQSTARARIAHAALTDTFSQHLASRLRNADSVGCPVAAHQRTINPSNHHVEYLVQNGHLTLQQRDSGKVIGKQTLSPIERSATVLANFIDKYVDNFGEPNESNVV